MNSIGDIAHDCYTPFTQWSKHEANVFNIHVHDVCSEFASCLLHCVNGVLATVVLLTSAIRRTDSRQTPTATGTVSDNEGRLQQSRVNKEQWDRNTYAETTLTVLTKFYCRRKVVQRPTMKILLAIWSSLEFGSILSEFEFDAKIFRQNLYIDGLIIKSLTLVSSSAVHGWSLLYLLILYSDVNESAAEAIMESVRVTIATYPFLLRNRREQVRILTGTEEAIFSWIATNYLAGNLGVCFYFNLFVILW